MVVCQPLYMGGDHYTLVLCFGSSSHLLLAFHAIPDVPYEQDWVDL